MSNIEAKRKEETMQKRMRRTMQVPGFTLLELMMVVIIIAILASIGLPQYIRATERARATEAINLLGAIRASQLRYKAQSPVGNFASVGGDLDFNRAEGALDGANDIYSEAWTLPNTNDGGGTTGFTQMKRRSGTSGYKDATIGIQFGSGKLCGSFPGFTGGTGVSGACVAD